LFNSPGMSLLSRAEQSNERPRVEQHDAGH
jgi:hypothetical protein